MYATVSPHLLILVQCRLPLWQLHSDLGDFNYRVCHVKVILITQQTLCFSLNILAGDSKMPLMTLPIASDWAPDGVVVVTKGLTMTLGCAEMDKKESKLMSYICDFSRQLDYLYKLITNISVQNLTQVSGESCVCVLVRGVTRILRCSTYVGRPEFTAGKWPAFFSAGGKK